MSLLYNDITDYPDPEDYLDNFTKKAVLDRFPPFRLHGKFKEDFDLIKEVIPTKYALENKEFYIKIIRTFLYFRDNLVPHGFSHSKLRPLPPRWKLNVSKLLRVVDVYCETQAEFDAWVLTINSSMQDYLDMVEYPKALTRLEKKVGVGVMDKHILKMNDMSTFTKKISYINDIINDKVPVSDTGIWDYEKVEEDIL